MNNNLFNQSLMKKYANNKAFDLNVSKHDFIKKHAEKVENGYFKSEVSSYLYFYDFLKEVLGYEREENILFDKKEDIGRGKSEFALKSGDNNFMVIELKDQTTDLDKPQNRVNDKRTPIDQAFDYAQHSDVNNPIDWIFVSNFKEFRLYNYTKRSNTCICFTHDDLMDKEKFKFFMVAFSKQSYINYRYPDKLLKETLVIEKQLESNFYKLFHETRLMLIRELEEFNHFNRVDAVHYAQLILNRYMFISFAEDTGLLTSQISTDTIVNPIKEGDLKYGGVWQSLNKLFRYINDGNEYKHIPAYNGGLFEKDLDFIKIRDTVEDQELFKDVWQDWKFDLYDKDIKHLLEPYGDEVNPIYKNLLTISSFDFSSELDVNILGHIFENSIGDLEELKEDVKGRRKKEGIFYTPEYITDYVCRNTIIPYLSKSGKSNTIEGLISEYWGSAIQELDQKVKNIKIVDPACGSGAFLSKGADVLLEIHQSIHEELYKDEKSTLIPYFDPIDRRREILLNNIFGVDLNEESVEITKLSLFLKVCQKDKKLPALDANIKCGNSLIDDPLYTDKPFYCEKEFKEIFKEGGFDVVIGNPPYVQHRKLKSYSPAFKTKYQTYTGTSDLYVYFYEMGIKLMKESGILAYISSNKFIKTRYGLKLRKFLSNYCIKQIIDFTESHVFSVLVASCILIISKKTSNKFILISSVNDTITKYNNLEEFVNQNNSKIASKLLDEHIWLLEDPLKLKIKTKIELRSDKILDYSNIKIFRGITTGFNDAFIINKSTRNELIKKDTKNKSVIKTLLHGRDIKRWDYVYNGKFMLYIPWEFPIDNYQEIKNYLLKFEGNLKKRPEVQSGRIKWFALSRYASDYIEEFKKEKIIWGLINSNWAFSYDNEGYYLPSNAYMLTSEGIPIKYLITLLNSKVNRFYFDFVGSMTAGGAFTLNRNSISELRIIIPSEKKQTPFIKKADLVLNLKLKLHNEVTSFLDWLMHTFSIEKLSKKLEKYYELSLEIFLDEVRKKKVDVKSRKNYQTFKNEYEESLAVIKPLLQQIKETDAEIDRMVYELYGLTEDEIQIIENSLF
jgi:hypothetical protein